MRKPYVIATTVSLVILAATAGVTWLAATTSSQEEPRRQAGPARPDSEDPTAVPTVTPPSEVPPPPDQLRNPTPGPTEERRAPERPQPSDVKQRSDGKYEATGPDGCVWVETGRTVLRRQKTSEAVLRTDCADDVVLRVDINTGETSLWATD